MNERDIFIAALQKESPAEIRAFLAEACKDDTSLCERIASLLDAHGRSGSFLDPPSPAPVPTAPEPTISERPGTLIGPYKLIEQIGEGGFGVVFMAEQREPMRRMVALKVIKPGMDSKQVVARFEAERQALAMMDHPNIAKILDAGTTEEKDEGGRMKDEKAKDHSGSSFIFPPSSFRTGRPYFVMELVRGIPITDYCDQAGFTVRTRLQLFVQVCRAVQHAHTKGVIHRDLKPGNVLVTSRDGVPVPYVIDFGVAKALDQQLSERSVHTGFAQMIGTPLYMSPEQAELNELGVDTRSDIYSLGILLYELLTGATPFDKERLRTVDFDEMRRILREEEPPRPSTRLSTLGAALSTVSERRGVDPRKLTQMLTGELDWIVLKALEKDRDRRYESASALAADVEHYLNDEQVEACPPSAGYRLRKYARRNRRVLAMSGIIAAALVAAAAVSTWQMVLAQEAQNQAEADREEAKMAQNQAESDRERAKTAEKRAKTAEKRATSEAAIAQAVNNFFQNDLLRQVDSVSQLNDEFGGDSNLTVKEALDRAASKIGERFQDQPLVEAAIREVIGAAYGSLHKPQLAMDHLERAVALRKAHLAPDHPDTLGSMGSLAGAWSDVGRHSDAIALCQQVLGYRTAQLGPDDLKTLASAVRLAGAYQFAGRWDKSVPLLEQTVEKQRTICGPTHPSTLGTMHNLARDYCEVDRFVESMALHQKVLETINFTIGPEQEPPIWVMMTFAVACQRAGKLDQADQLLREALEQNRKRKDSLGKRHQQANTLGWLALNRVLGHRDSAAEPLVRQAVAIFEKEHFDARRRCYWLSLLGEALAGQEKYAEAEPYLLQGYEGMKQQEATLRGMEPRWLAEMGERVVRFYEVTNQPDKGRAWREKVQSPVPPK